MTPTVTTSFRGREFLSVMIFSLLPLWPSNPTTIRNLSRLRTHKFIFNHKFTGSNLLQLQNWGHCCFLGHFTLCRRNQSVHSWCQLCSLCVNSGFGSKWSSSHVAWMEASCWQRHMVGFSGQILQLRTHKWEMSSADISYREWTDKPLLLVFILHCETPA